MFLYYFPLEIEIKLIEGLSLIYMCIATVKFYGQNALSTKGALLINKVSITTYKQVQK